MAASNQNGSTPLRIVRTRTLWWPERPLSFVEGLLQRKIRLDVSCDLRVVVVEGSHNLAQLPLFYVDSRTGHASVLPYWGRQSFYWFWIKPLQSATGLQQLGHRLVPVLCCPPQRRLTVAVPGVRVDGVLGEQQVHDRLVRSLWPTIAASNRCSPWRLGRWRRRVTA
jgi:hypothetical protein